MNAELQRMARRDKKAFLSDQCKETEKEFRIMLVNMIQILRKGMEAKVEKTQKVFTEDLQELKKKQTEMNNALEGIQSRITEV